MSFLRREPPTVANREQALKKESSGKAAACCHSERTDRRALQDQRTKALTHRY